MTAWGSITELLGDDLDDIEFLGRGSSGSVYRATQRSLGRTVAVKVFRRFADDETDRVLVEARAQAALSWHANVVSLYSHGVTPDGFPYLIMEYAPGGSLADRVADRGPMPEDDWRQMGTEVASALAAAHEAGVIHCDVKPSNILFAADGSARLADFGIAKATGMTSGTIDSIEGSLAYLAPELLDGEKPRPCNDIYSLGLTLRFGASGQQPYGDLPTAALMAQIHSGPPSLKGVGLTPAGRSAIEPTLSTQCSDRPDASALQASLGPESRHTAGTTTGTRKRTALLGILGVMSVALLVGSAFQLARPAPTAETEPAPDLCAAFEEFVRGREAMFATVSADLEVETDPYQMVKRILIDYPTDHSQRAQRYLGVARAIEPQIPEVTTAQLVEMSQASVLRDFSDGKAFLFDGETGEFDPTGLPAEVREPARAFSAGTSLGASECRVESEITAGKARMRSAIYSNLADPEFMDGFFSDPRSMDLLNPDFVLLMADMARGPVEILLSGHWDWFVDYVLRDSEGASRIVARHPDLLLTAVREHPDREAEVSAQADLLNSWEAGMAGLSPASRAGIEFTFANQIARFRGSVQ